MQAFRLVVVTIGCVISGSLWAQSIDLHPKFRVGATYHYRLTAELDVAGTPATYDASTVYRVLKLDADGLCAMEISTIPGGKAKLSGSDIDAPAPGPEIQVRKLTGELENITGPMVQPDTFRIANLLTLIVPPRPILVGDSWTHDLPVGPKNGVPIHFDYKAVSASKLAIDKMGDVDSVLISLEAKEISGTEAAFVSAQIWLDPADFSVLKMESRWRNAPFPGRSGPVSGKLTLVREPAPILKAPQIKQKTIGDLPGGSDPAPAPTKPVTPPATSLIFFRSSDQNDWIIFMSR